MIQMTELADLRKLALQALINDSNSKMSSSNQKDSSNSHFIKTTGLSLLCDDKIENLLKNCDEL
jgi:hypothetical protein